MKTTIRKTITVSAIVFSTLILLDVVKAPDALLRFFAAGHVPGTQWYIDASTMFSLWVIVAGVIAGRLTVRLALAIVRYNDKHPRRQNA
jgi:hypothetical protein